MIRALFKVIVLLLVMFSEKLCAQDNPINNYIPPSPTASNLTKFAMIPVNGYTGMANIEIPLYTAKSGSLALPITLQYSSNGVKPNEQPGWVGEGWNMIAGGVITRSVNYYPDEKNDQGFFYHADLPLDPYANSKMVPMNAANYPPFLPDPDPDVFYYNFCGYSGKFFRNNSTDLESKQFDFTPNTNFKVEYTTQSDYIDQIIITDDKGIKYTFGNEGASPTYSDNAVEFVTTGFPKSTAFYLSKIEAPNGDFINLTYKSIGSDGNPIIKNNEYYDEYDASTTPLSSSPPEEGISSFMQLFSLGLDLNGEPFDDGLIETLPPTFSLAHHSSVTTSYLTFLNEIQTKNEKIVFTVENHAYGESQRLQNIEIFNQNNVSFKKYEFKYKANDYRLMLASVQEKANSISVPPYVFDYYNYGGIPSDVITNHIDHWGYYNGNINNTSSYIPSCTVINNQIVYPEREPDTTASKYNMLTSITYPTKGTATITYEPNSYKSSGILSEGKVLPKNYSTTKYGGGVRVKSITYVDPILNITQKIDYTYGNGILYLAPIYYKKAISINPATLSREIYSECNRNSFCPLGSPAVSYPFIKEKYSNGSYKVTNYSTLFNVNDVFINFYDTYNTLGYENALTDYSNKRGKVISEISYDKWNQPVQEITNQYFEKTIKKDVGLKLLILARINHIGKYLSSYYNDYTFSYLGTKTVKTYDQKNINNFITEEYTYLYDDVYYQLSETNQLNSDGSKTRTIFTYPLNYEKNWENLNYDATSNILHKMVLKNILTPNVEKTVLKDNKVISSEITLFRETPEELIVPDVSYKLSSTNPFDLPIIGLSYTTLQNGNVSFEKSSNYVPEVYFDKYDAQGNVLQIHKANNIVTSYIWGYNNSLPIVQANNANLDEVAYCGFDEQSAGWTFYGYLPIKTDPATAKFGSKFFSFVQEAPGHEYSITSPSLVLNDYKVSFFAKGTGTINITSSLASNTATINSTQWVYNEFIIASQNNITLSSNDYIDIDEIRIAPTKSNINTYCYNPQIGMTSYTDNNGITTFYEYDNLGRLIKVKDYKGNILKYYEYMYKQ